ncbi:response regulator transcription factor [Enterovibrio calviensis]|uniref:response regulator transcription factor n=1 Tax=Enterovibrio calviensis TaxID=91359 RepID=UPI00047FB3EB|nr:response regulator transcription factor [Enterovibrio calviensis]
MKILVIEDDVTTRTFIATALTQEGFVVDEAAQGREGLMMATSSEYQLIILDRMLPELNGMQILSALRAACISTPVIILSAMDSIEDKVAGLSAGSDDYLTKPFALVELLARVNSILRRQNQASPLQHELIIRSLRLNLRSHKVDVKGEPLKLQNKEFILLHYLMDHAGEVVSRMRLFEAVWDYHFDPKTNVIDVHIANLRKKLEAAGANDLIETVRGAGYVIR